MTDARAVMDADRLPWLPNDPLRIGGDSWQPVVLWALAAVLIVAGVSFWMGLQSQITDPEPSAIRGRSGPAATVTLPAPAPPAPIQRVEPLPIVEIEPARPPAVEPAPVRAVERVGSRTVEKPVAAAKPAVERPARKKAAAGPRPAPKLTLWSAMRSEGASGRMVRVGTFASRRQAKIGWRKVIGIYPGLRRLPAAVVPIQSRRNGQLYYRLQMGTTSQAHSTVVCQWMRMIGQGCVVVGLPPASTAS